MPGAVRNRDGEQAQRDQADAGSGADDLAEGSAGGGRGGEQHVTNRDIFDVTCQRSRTRDAFPV